MYSGIVIEKAQSSAEMVETAVKMDVKAAATAAPPIVGMKGRVGAMAKYLKGTAVDTLVFSLRQADVPTDASTCIIWYQNNNTRTCLGMGRILSSLT